MSIEKIESFFSQNSVAAGNYSAPAHTKSIDGTGKDVSVGKNVGDQLVKYIIKKFNPSTVLDIGTGKGHMVNSLRDHDICGFGIEGSSSLVPMCVCDKNNYAILDITKSINDERLHKAFDLTTSFEMFEHIHRSHEDQLLKNLAFLSDWHFCSIHMDGWPGVAVEHCNIKHECCWMELFRKHNIKCEVLGHARYAKIAKRAVGEPGSRGVTWGPNHYCEVRDNVKFGQWNEWEWSMFCVLDLREFQEN